MNGPKGVRLTSVEGDQRLVVALVEPGLAAFGPVAEVRRAIDTKSGGGGSMTGNPDPENGSIREVDAGDAWAAGPWDALTAAGGFRRGLPATYRPITWFAATGQRSPLSRAQRKRRAPAGRKRFIQGRSNHTWRTWCSSTAR